MSSKKNTPVQIRLTEETRAQIDEVRGDAPIAQVLRDALELYLTKPCGHCGGTGRKSMKR